MGISYEDLKARGNSIIKKRQETIVIKRSANSFTKRKHRIITETFSILEGNHHKEKDSDIDSNVTDKTKLPQRNSKKREAAARNSNEAEKSTVIQSECNERASNSKGKESDTMAKRYDKSLLKLCSKFLENKDFQSVPKNCGNCKYDLERDLNHEINKLQRQRSLLEIDFLTNKKNESIVTKKSSTTWAEKLTQKKPINNISKDEQEVKVAQHFGKHKYIGVSPRYAGTEDFSLSPKTRTLATQMYARPDHRAVDDYQSEKLRSQLDESGKHMEHRACSQDHATRDCSKCDSQNCRHHVDDMKTQNIHCCSADGSRDGSASFNKKKEQVCNTNENKRITQKQRQTSCERECKPQSHGNCEKECKSQSRSHFDRESKPQSQSHCEKECKSQSNSHREEECKPQSHSEKECKPQSHSEKEFKQQSHSHREKEFKPQSHRHCEKECIPQGNRHYEGRSYAHTEREGQAKEQRNNHRDRSKSNKQARNEKVQQYFNHYNMENNNVNDTVDRYIDQKDKPCSPSGTYRVKSHEQIQEITRNRNLEKRDAEGNQYLQMFAAHKDGNFDRGNNGERENDVCQTQKYKSIRGDRQNEIRYMAMNEYNKSDNIEEKNNGQKLEKSDIKNNSNQLYPSATYRIVNNKKVYTITRGYSSEKRESTFNRNGNSVDTENDKSSPLTRSLNYNSKIEKQNNRNVFHDHIDTTDQTSAIETYRNSHIEKIIDAGNQKFKAVYSQYSQVHVKPNEELFNLESYKEADYSPETINMLKKMRVREYKPTKPKERDHFNSNYNEVLNNNRHNKNQRYEEYIQKYKTSDNEKEIDSTDRTDHHLYANNEKYKVTPTSYGDGYEEGCEMRRNPTIILSNRKDDETSNSERKNEKYVIAPTSWDGKEEVSEVRRNPTLLLYNGKNNENSNSSRKSTTNAYREEMNKQKIDKLQKTNAEGSKLQRDEISSTDAKVSDDKDVKTNKYHRYYVDKIKDCIDSFQKRACEKIGNDNSIYEEESKSSSKKTNDLKEELYDNNTKPWSFRRALEKKMFSDGDRYPKREEENDNLTDDSTVKSSTKSTAYSRVTDKSRRQGVESLSYESENSTMRYSLETNVVSKRMNETTTDGTYYRDDPESTDQISSYRYATLRHTERTMLLKSRAESRKLAYQRDYKSKERLVVKYASETEISSRNPPETRKEMLTYNKTIQRELNPKMFQRERNEIGEEENALINHVPPLQLSQSSREASESFSPSESHKLQIHNHVPQSFSRNPASSSNQKSITIGKIQRNFDKATAEDMSNFDQDTENKNFEIKTNEVPNRSHEPHRNNEIINQKLFEVKRQTTSTIKKKLDGSKLQTNFDKIFYKESTITEDNFNQDTENKSLKIQPNNVPNRSQELHFNNQKHFEAERQNSSFINENLDSNLKTRQELFITDNEPASLFANRKEQFPKAYTRASLIRENEAARENKSLPLKLIASSKSEEASLIEKPEEFDLANSTPILSHGVENLTSKLLMQEDHLQRKSLENCPIRNHECLNENDSFTQKSISAKEQKRSAIAGEPDNSHQQSYKQLLSHDGVTKSSSCKLLEREKHMLGEHFMDYPIRTHESSNENAIERKLHHTNENAHRSDQEITSQNLGNVGKTESLADEPKRKHDSYQEEELEQKAVKSPQSWYLQNLEKDKLSVISREPEQQQPQSGYPPNFELAMNEQFDDNQNLVFRESEQQTGKSPQSSYLPNLEKDKQILISREPEQQAGNLPHSSYLQNFDLVMNEQFGDMFNNGVTLKETLRTTSLNSRNREPTTPVKYPDPQVRSIVEAPNLNESVRDKSISTSFNNLEAIIGLRDLLTSYQADLLQSEELKELAEELISKLSSCQCARSSKYSRLTEDELAAIGPEAEQLPIAHNKEEDTITPSVLIKDESDKSMPKELKQVSENISTFEFKESKEDQLQKSISSTFNKTSIMEEFKEPKEDRQQKFLSSTVSQTNIREESLIMNSVVSENFSSSSTITLKVNSSISSANSHRNPSAVLKNHFEENQTLKTFKETNKEGETLSGEAKNNMPDNETPKHQVSSLDNSQLNVSDHEVLGKQDAMGSQQDHNSQNSDDLIYPSTSAVALKRTSTYTKSLSCVVPIEPAAATVKSILKQHPSKFCLLKESKFEKTTMITDIGGHIDEVNKKARALVVKNANNTAMEKSNTCIISCDDEVSLKALSKSCCSSDSPVRVADKISLNTNSKNVHSSVSLTTSTGKIEEQEIDLNMCLDEVESCSSAASFRTCCESHETELTCHATNHPSKQIVKQRGSRNLQDVRCIRTAFVEEAEFSNGADSNRRSILKDQQIFQRAKNSLNVLTKQEELECRTKNKRLIRRTSIYNRKNVSSAYLESKYDQTERERSPYSCHQSEFANYSPIHRNDNAVPAFTNCPCMMDTYIKILEIYYKGKQNKHTFNR